MDRTDHTETETEVETDTDTDTDTELSLSAQHHQWKLKVATELHNYADEQKWCGDFDLVLGRVGLPARPGYDSERCNDPTCCPPPKEAIGEDTAAEHEQWKRETARTFHEAAARYGISVGWEERLTDLGFPARTLQHVKVEGTFSIPATINTFGGEGFIDALSHREVRQLVQDYFYQNSVQWKIVAADGEDNEDDDHKSS